jgi:hypothetical protein
MAELTETQRNIAALKENASALKEPLRKRYWELELAIYNHEAPLRALKDQRDELGGSVTLDQDREFDLRIAKLRDELSTSGLSAMVAERKDILRALLDDDGKSRLGTPEQYGIERVPERTGA